MMKNPLEKCVLRLTLSGGILNAFIRLGGRSEFSCLPILYDISLVIEVSEIR